jgi:hypothetical protein
VRWYNQRHCFMTCYIMWYIWWFQRMLRMIWMIVFSFCEEYSG